MGGLETKQPLALAVRVVVSGGQTGVDRAGLDVALQLGYEIGGWVPKGRLAEDGTVPEHYPMREMPRADYPSRTEQNIIDSDATLIFCQEKPTGGTGLTLKLAKQLRKPVQLVAFDDSAPQREPGDIAQWLVDRQVQTLNVAGPRQSEYAAGYARAFEFLREVLTQQ